jgi:hypothetical protein
MKKQHIPLIFCALSIFLCEIGIYRHGNNIIPDIVILWNLYFINDYDT